MANSEAGKQKATILIRHFKSLKWYYNHANDTLVAYSLYILAPLQGLPSSTLYPLEAWDMLLQHDRCATTCLVDCLALYYYGV